MIINFILNYETTIVDCHPKKIGAVSQRSPYSGNPDGYSFVSTRVNNVSRITTPLF